MSDKTVGLPSTTDTASQPGEGEDGRIKSAIGIAPLLEHAIGDTIRVSLTEEAGHHSGGQRW